MINWAGEDMLRDATAIADRLRPRQIRCSMNEYMLGEVPGDMMVIPRKDGGQTELVPARDVEEGRFEVVP